MPFGTENSKATFQRLMDLCFKDLEGVEVYVDDIVIFSDTWEEHLKRLEQVMFQLKEANLTVNLSMSEKPLKSKGFLIRACSRSWSCDTN